MFSPRHVRALIPATPARTANIADIAPGKAGSAACVNNETQQMMKGQMKAAPPIILGFLILALGAIAQTPAPSQKDKAQAHDTDASSQDVDAQQRNAGLTPPEVVRSKEVQIEGEVKTLTVGNEHELYHLTCNATLDSCVTPVSGKDYLVFSKTTRWQMPGAKVPLTLKFFQDFSVMYNNQENIALFPAEPGTDSSFGMYVLLSAVPASPQTGRDYFNELKATDLLNTYSDEYVCFDDSNIPSFTIIAKAADVIQMMKKAGATAEAKDLEQSQFKDSLIVQKYYKGVGAGRQFYDAAGTEGTDFIIVFKDPLNGEMTYSINWATGRYILRVYDLDRSKTVPAIDYFGKCELIHPDLPMPRH
jgi:hypothetical protein